MIRVLLVSHTYVAPINRAKLDALARHVTLTALIPARWRDALFTLHVDCTCAINYTCTHFPFDSRDTSFLREYR